MIEAPAWTRIDVAIDEALRLRRAAISFVGSELTEVYVKSALRVRFERRCPADPITSSVSFECGTSLRWREPRSPDARHAAISGLDASAFEHLVEGAAERPPNAEPAMAGVEHAVPAERRDIDGGEPLGASGPRRWLEQDRGRRWAEVGTTHEVIAGPGGWFAARSRDRFWGMVDPERGQLVAGRGFEPPADEVDGWLPDELGGGTWLSPEAAAALIDPLVAVLHREGADPGLPTGRAWKVADDPRHAAGIAGGSFDDGGFETRATVLAEGGRIAGTIGGPGQLWRRSYRDAPTAQRSTLVLLPGETGASRASGEGCVERCRVLPLEDGAWVVALSGRHRNGWVRAEPGNLVRAIGRAGGQARLTSRGIVTPAIRLDGLPLSYE